MGGNLLKALHRITGILLIFYFSAYIISGYGITKPELINKLTFGMLSRGIAYDLHSSLIIPITLLFLIHAAIGIKNMKIKLELDKEVTRDDILLSAFILFIYFITLISFFR